MNETIKKVTMRPGRYSISRKGDGAGDSGPVLKSIDLLTAERVGENGDIIVGCCIECGSITARSYSAQDFWLTTPITEIVSVAADKSEVIVRTRSGSEYIIKSF